MVKVTSLLRLCVLQVNLLLHFLGLMLKDFDLLNPPLLLCSCGLQYCCPKSGKGDT